MKKALVVGIDNYQGNDVLNGCVNDANAIKKVLERHGDGSLNYDVNCLENIQNKDDLTQKIEDLFNGDCESALFYFSGHGYVDKHGAASLVTPDMSINSMGIRMDDILLWANESKIKNKIIILDCCFSGNMGNFSGDGTKTNLSDGVTILTASKAEEPSMEIEGHGVFTTLLLSALDGGASDILGNTTPGSIYSYIDNALGPWEQRPVFKSNVSKFDVIRKVCPVVDIKILRELPSIFSNGSTVRLDPSFEDTNTLETHHKVVEPYANNENVKIFKKLQKLESRGLVKPVGEQHMYYAAMNSKCCELTAIGKYYLNLAKSKRI